MNERNKITADDAFAEKASQLFDESVESLDGATRSKLNRGRQAALAEIRTRGGRSRWAQWAPVGGLAVAAVAAFAIWTGNPQIDEMAAPAVASDMEILLTEDSLEMLEDLEFYSWIDFEGDADEAETPANNVG